MNIWIGILGGLAAAAAFFVVETYLLGIDLVWRLVGAGVVFVLSVGLAFYLQQRNATAQSDGSGIMSDNEVAKGMTAKIDNLETSKSGSKVLSNNKVGGSANFEIKNSKF